MLSFFLSFFRLLANGHQLIYFLFLLQFLIFRYLKHIDNGLLYYLQSDQTQVSQKNCVPFFGLKILEVAKLSLLTCKGNFCSKIRFGGSDYSS